MIIKSFKKILAIFLLIILCTSCNSSKIKNLSYTELSKKLENNETFFFVVIKDGCPYCEKFIPKVEEVLNEYNISGFTINYSSLSEKEDEEFYDMFGVDSTPTTIFIKDGKEISVLQRLVGNVSKEKLINKLKVNEYIKEG